MLCNFVHPVYRDDGNIFRRRFNACLLRLCGAQSNVYSYIRTCIYTKIKIYLSICLVVIHLPLNLSGSYACVERYGFISLYMDIYIRNILWVGPRAILSRLAVLTSPVLGMHTSSIVSSGPVLLLHFPLALITRP